MKLKSREEFSRRSLFKKGSKLLKKLDTRNCPIGKREQYPSLKWETDYTFEVGYLLVPPKREVCESHEALVRQLNEKVLSESPKCWPRPGVERTYFRKDEDDNFLKTFHLPHTCDTFTDESACENALGCYWNPVELTLPINDQSILTEFNKDWEPKSDFYGMRYSVITTTEIYREASINHLEWEQIVKEWKEAIKIKMSKGKSAKKLLP